MDRTQLAAALEVAMRGKGGLIWRVQHLSAPKKSGTRSVIVDEVFHNLWPDAMSVAALDYAFRAQTPPTNWYIGLKDTGTPAAADTLSSHSSWAELAGSGTVYDGDRKGFTFSAASVVSGVPTITGGTPAEFTISSGVSAQNVSGALLATAPSGTSGVLGPVGNFSSPLSVNATEIVRVTPSLTLDDDGV